MKSLTYISTLLPDMFSDAKSKGMIQYSADNMSSVFLEGLLHQNSPEQIHVVNIQPISAWPTQSEYVRIKKTILRRHGKEICNTPYWNVALIRQVSKYFGLIKTCKSFLKTDSALIIYSMTTPLLALARYAKKRYGIKTCMIVPDLPAFAARNSSGLKKAAKKMDVILQQKLYKYIDIYALFSDNMKERFQISEKDYVVIEGAVSQQSIEIERTIPARVRKNGKPVILYSGQIEYINGIRELISAVEEIENQVELVIIGSGKASEYVIEKAKENIRIKYLGTMPHEQVIIEQHKADILINPRPPLEFTKYSFPSKTLEYMLSGTPVLMQRLEGVPEEYDQYLNYCTFETMGKMIKEIVENYDEYKEKAMLGREFIMNEKSSSKQMRKMLEALEM